MTMMERNNPSGCAWLLIGTSVVIWSIVIFLVIHWIIVV